MTLEIKNLNVSYGDFEVLKNVSFKLEDGQIIGLVAPNGTGKTTMFNAIMRFIPILEGEILIDNISYSPSDKDVLALHQKITFFPDQGDLFENFSGRCFKCNNPLSIEKRGEWAIDHIMPSALLYPLVKRNAALLCSDCNDKKRAKLPSEFYNNEELKKLATITGANLELLASTEPNINKKDVDVNVGVDNYLSTRRNSNLSKRIRELKKVIERYGLQDELTPENKKKLGFE